VEGFHAQVLGWLNIFIKVIVKDIDVGGILCSSSNKGLNIFINNILEHFDTEELLASGIG
jgi:hypothetical protein